MYVFHTRHFYYLRGNKRMKRYDAFPEPIGGYTVGRTQLILSTRHQIIQKEN